MSGLFINQIQEFSDLPEGVAGLDGLKHLYSST